MNALSPETLPSLAFLLIPLQIVVVNVLLSADNALAIALACRGLPAQDRPAAMLIGTTLAAALRVAFGAVALTLMRAPYLRIVAGALLLWIAARLVADHAQGGADAGDDASVRKTMIAAIGAIVVADATMSLDNVVAVAAIAQDSFLWLALGLALSIPLLFWGSDFIHDVLTSHRLFVVLGGAFLGWIAGGIAVSDPAVAAGVDANAPALPYTVPAAGALFVLAQSFFAPRRAVEAEAGP